MVKDGSYIDIKKLNLDELNGVVSLYPWFANARVELCERMSRMGEGAWEEERYAEQALYVCSRRIVRELYLKSLHKEETPVIETRKPAYKSTRQVFVVGGDYFTPEQYEGVRLEEDNIFSSFAGKGAEASTKETTVSKEGDFIDFCTEPLAQIYLDQGYKDKAKEIYSKLSLRNPEKSVYFAALIEKIDSEQ